MLKELHLSKAISIFHDFQPLSNSSFALSIYELFYLTTDPNPKVEFLNQPDKNTHMGQSHISFSFFEEEPFELGHHLRCFRTFYQILL